MRLLTVVAFCLTVTLSVATAPIDQMMKWFPGEFDNYDQLEKFTMAHITEEHDKLHSIFFKASLPAFSANVLYVQQCSGGDPSKLYRQRLYVLKSVNDSVTMDIWQFKDPSAFVDAHKHPELLAGLTPNSPKVSITTGCSVAWQYDSQLNQFNGSTGESCTAAIKDYPVAGQHEYLITDSNVLSANQVWIHEQWYLFDGGVKGKKVLGKVHPDIETRSNPIRKFVGWLAIINPKEANGYSTMYNVVLFDSGTVVRALDSKNQSLPYQFELAQASYADKPPPIFKLAFYEDGKGQYPGNATDYVWASPNAVEIGINLRFVQGGFKLAPEEHASAGLHPDDTFYVDHQWDALQAQIGNTVQPL